MLTFKVTGDFMAKNSKLSGSFSAHYTIKSPVSLDAEDGLVDGDNPYLREANGVLVFDSMDGGITKDVATIEACLIDTGCVYGEMGIRAESLFDVMDMDSTDLVEAYN